MPVRHTVVHAATPRARRCARARAIRRSLQPFVEAGRELVARLAPVALTTSCGFLAAFQAPLQRRPAPCRCGSSSLLKLRELRRPGVAHGGCRRRSARAHLLRRRRPRATPPVEGLAPGCHLQRTLLEDACPSSTPRRRATMPAGCAPAPGGRHPARCDAMRAANARTCRPRRRRCSAPPAGPCHHLMTLVHERWNPRDAL
jgi:hypothetical protein